MSKERNRSDHGRKPVWAKKTLILAILLMTAVGAVAVVALLRGGGGSQAAYTPVDSFHDIHGLAIDPRNSSILYVATHQGLIRGVNDREWALVGNYRADFMGFSMHPDGKVFYSSGHKIPDAPLMGVARSDDDGHSWRIIALRNQVDFHAMTISKANAQILYAWYYRDGRLYKSLDGGSHWQNPAAEGLKNVLALATDPTDEKIIWAATQQGLYRSLDGGQRFELIRFSGDTVTTVAVDPSDSRVLYAWVVGQGLLKSFNRGESWQVIGSDLDVGGKDAVGQLAIDPSNSGRIYAATFSAAIYKSLDSGETWQILKRGETMP